MYQTHYHLKTQPFSEHAAVSSLWLDDRIQEGLARLTYLVEHATLGLITGPTGVASPRCSSVPARSVAAAV